MKKEHTFAVLDVIVLSIVVIFSVGFIGELLTKTAIRDTVTVQVVHDAKYYADALIVDRAIISILPDAKDFVAAKEGNNPKKLAELLVQTANAYTTFAVQTKDKNQALLSWQKFAYYDYLAGIVYRDFLNDNKTACWYYGAALAADQNNPLYGASYDSPVCRTYRNK